jgi:transcriptional regulator with XRE-family HTH domain
VDLKKLRAYRHRQNLTLAQVEAQTGIPRSSLCDFEKGRIVLQLHKILALVELYDLDVFDLIEIFRLKVFSPGYIGLFRAACARANCSSREVLEYLIEKFYLEYSPFAQHPVE